VMEPTGKAYVASGRWSVLGEVHRDGAEGAVRSEPPILNLPEVVIPFDGVFRKAA